MPLIEGSQGFASWRKRWARRAAEVKARLDDDQAAEAIVFLIDHVVVWTPDRDAVLEALSAATGALGPRLTAVVGDDPIPGAC
jgi:hypothetical protein